MRFARQGTFSTDSIAGPSFGVLTSSSHWGCAATILANRRPPKIATNWLPWKPEREVPPSSVPDLVDIMGTWTPTSGGSSVASPCESPQPPCLMARPIPTVVGLQPQPQALPLRQQRLPMLEARIIPARASATRGHASSHFRRQRMSDFLLSGMRQTQHHHRRRHSIIGCLPYMKAGRHPCSCRTCWRRQCPRTYQPWHVGGRCAPSPGRTSGASPPASLPPDTAGVCPQPAAKLTPLPCPIQPRPA